MGPLVEIDVETCSLCMGSIKLGEKVTLAIFSLPLLHFFTLICQGQYSQPDYFLYAAGHYLE